MSPKVSICIPTRNRAPSLRQTLEAMLAQSYQDFEIVVGDDASDDGTREVVAGMKDTRIRYHRHERNVGIYPNWNSLIDLASGEMVAIFHDHDVYLPTIVERSMALLTENPRVVFAHSAVVLVDRDRYPLRLLVEDLSEVTPGRRMQEFFVSGLGRTICAATTVVRKEAYEAVGRFDPSYGHGCDKEMWLRLCRRGDVGYVRAPQALILGRSQGDALEGFSAEFYRGQLRLLNEAAADLWGESPTAKKAVERARRECSRVALKSVVKAMAVDTPERVAERSRDAAPLVLGASRAALDLLVASGAAGRLLARKIALPRYRRGLDAMAREALRACQNDTRIAGLVQGGGPPP